MTLPTERLLDPETEHVIARFSEIITTYRSPDYTLDKDRRQHALDLLRSRIRTLIEEARKEGRKVQAEADRQTVRDFR